MKQGTAVTARREKMRGEVASGAERTRARVYHPLVDISETPEEIRVQADMPGTRAGDIDVQFENGTLTIYGRVPREEEENQRRYRLREYGVGDFYRAFEIGEAVDASGITAEYGDGVLTLRLPKSAALRPRKIQVKGADA